MPVFKSNAWGWNGKKDPLTTREQYKRVDGANWYKPALVAEVDMLNLSSGSFTDTVAMQDQIRKKIVENEFVPQVKKQLDAQLEVEFKDWLLGRSKYNNNVTLDKPVMRQVMDVFQTEKNEHNPAFNPRGDFHRFAHTHWGTQSLVHLPGVRNFVADDETTLRDEQLKMAKLAYFGPGNIEDAWIYFNFFLFFSFLLACCRHAGD